MFKIGKYEHGSEIQLLDTIYVNPHPTSDGKWTDGTLFIVYRDIKTGEKKVDVQKNPKSHIYFTKPEYKYDFKTRRKQLEIEKLDEVVVPYKDITKAIRDKIKEYDMDHEYLEIYDMAIKERKSRMKKELFKWRHTYYSDYDIGDYVWTQTNLAYNQSVTKLTKTFLDIEVDVYGRTERDRVIGACPIHCITMVINHDIHGNILDSPMAIQLLLRNYRRYKGQEAFENNIAEYYKKCKEDFDKLHNNPKFIVKFYDDDLSMLKDFFGVIHAYKSDFNAIWNMDFDVNYIISRLQYLGENPVSYFSHPDFKDDPYISYNRDEFNKNDFKNRTDSFDCTCYSRWMCQMLLYAGKRKSLAEYGGVSLDNIAKLELGLQKREYSDPHVTVINAAIENYLEFALYSINDSLLLYKLDIVTEDIDAIYDQAYYSGVRFIKVLKPSISSKTDFILDYYKMGLILGNNVNIDYTNFGRSEDELSYRDDEDLAGAFVGNPYLNANVGVEIYGVPSNMYYNDCLDMDAEALYPNIKVKFQLAEDIQYFRLIIEKRILEDENPLDVPTFMRAGKFVEDLECGDITKIAKWFYVKPVYKYMQKYAEKKGGKFKCQL